MENQATIMYEYPDEALQSAKSMISSLILTMKIHDLYPESHIRCQQAVSRFNSDLETFLRSHGDLSLVVKGNDLIFRGEVVYSGSDKEGDLAFALFRDGIALLEFQEGIEFWQTEEFLKILNNYKKLPVDSDGDLVTALWEAQLPNLRYEALDNIFETKTLDDFSIATDQETQPPESLFEKKLLGWESNGASNIFNIFQDSPAEVRDFQTIDQDSLALTSEDALIIEKMILRQEESDNTQELIDMFKDILIGQKDQRLFTSIFEFLQDEIEGAFVLADIGRIYEILQKLHDARKSWEDDRAFTVSLLENLSFYTYSAPAFWKLLERWSEDEPAWLEKLKPLMLTLHPKAIQNLGPLLSEISSSKVQTLFAEVIISLAARDLTHLECLIRDSEADLVKRLLPLLGHLDCKESAQLLLEMARHSSMVVRKEALRVLVLRDIWAPKALFHLIDDDNDFIRRLFIKYLGSRRCQEAESLLLNYLQTRKVRNLETGHLFSYFRTLGKCGADRSIQFFQQIISKRGWFLRSRSSPLRQAAAIALGAFEAEETKDIPFKGLIH